VFAGAGRQAKSPILAVPPRRNPYSAELLFVPLELLHGVIGAMGSLVLAVFAYIRAFLVPRHKLSLEAAALRQQLAS
jgi:hypothetical protein